METHRQTRSQTKRQRESPDEDDIPRLGIQGESKSVKEIEQELMDLLKEFGTVKVEELGLPPGPRVDRYMFRDIVFDICGVIYYHSKEEKPVHPGFETKEEFFDQNEGLSKGAIYATFYWEGPNNSNEFLLCARKFITDLSENKQVEMVDIHFNRQCYSFSFFSS